VILIIISSAQAVFNCCS